MFQEDGNFRLSTLQPYDTILKARKVQPGALLQKSGTSVQQSLIINSPRLTYIDILIIHHTWSCQALFVPAFTYCKDLWRKLQKYIRKLWLVCLLPFVLQRCGHKK